MSNYYPYIYLNPLKPGRYMYGNFVTLFYEPFYVGKGNKNRLYSHLYESKNISKNNFKLFIINEIKINNLEPYIIKLIDNLEEQCSICYEKYLISLIGRKDLGLGPLSNLTDGGEGIINPSKFFRDKRKSLMSGSLNPMKKLSTRIKVSNSLKGRIVRINYLKNKIEEYNKNPKICIICNNSIPYNRKNNKTCKSECSKIVRINLNSSRITSLKTKLKMSESKIVNTDETYRIEFFLKNVSKLIQETI